MRIDIAKFFPSIDHEQLLRLILPRTPRSLHWLAERIVRQGGPCEPTHYRFPGDDLQSALAHPRGLPIGNLTSQVWANAMLTPVDHLLASGLGLGTFVRYCDDLLVYSHDRERLVDAWARIEERCNALRLRLHPQKCRLHRTTEPVAFLGFVLTRVENAVQVRLRSENVRRFRARMALVSALFDAGALELDDVTARLRAWLAHARHGHTRSLVQRELQRLTF